MRKGIRALEILHGFLLLAMFYDGLMQALRPGDPGAIYKNILLLPAVAVLSVASRQVKYFWQFLLLVMGTAGAVFYGGGRGFWLGGCVLLAAVSYFLARAKKEKCWLEAPAYPWLMGYLLLLFEGEYLHNDYMTVYLSTKAAAYFLIYNFHTNLVEMERFVKSHGNLERLPVKRIGRINQMMMWAFNGIIAAAMVVSPFLGIDGMIRQLGRALKQIVRWMIQLLFKEGGTSGEVPVPQQSGMPMLPVAGEQETSLWVDILYLILDILGWIIAIALVLAILWVIFRRLYFLYQNFHTHTEENGDQVERLGTAAIMEEKRRLKQIKREHLFWDRSTNGRIRKYYKKRVLGAWREAPPAWYTPSDLEKEIEMGEEEREKFHMLYEKARYGKEECSREEMETMLKLKR